MRTSVLSWLEESYRRYPDRIAVQDENEDITYFDLRRKALSVCSFIQEKTDVRHRPVLVLLPKGAVNIPCFMGILYSGNIYCPSEVSYPLNKIKSIIDILSPVMILTNRDMSLKLRDSKADIMVECIEDIDFNRECDLESTFYSEIISTDPVYILFTSGSTGVPKGVIINNQNIIDYIDWVLDTFTIDEKDILGNQAPFYFDNSTLDIYACMGSGACLSIIPKDKFIFPLELMEYVAERQITVIFWVPSVLSAVYNSKALDNTGKDLKLKNILFAGEVLPAKHLNYWTEKISNGVFANLYGPTEITVDCTCYIVDRKFREDESIPIGKSCRNTRVYLLDESHGKIDQENAIGEIAVEGVSVSGGYWNNKEQTEKSFIQNPVITGYSQRIYLTGDLGYYNERAEIIFVGRKDTQIKHMGYRIELGEIESVSQNNIHILSACTLYDKRNQNIVLICETDQNVTVKEIKGYLRENLPKYMMPKKVLFIDRMPLNDNGKLDRKLLQRRFLDNE